MTYSQNGEDLIVAQHFDRIGVHYGWILDIGANDGVTFSNSRLLIERGWWAHLVDADPYCVCRLLDRYGGNHHVHVTACAVTPSPTGGTVRMTLSRDGLYSTCYHENAEKWRQEMTRKVVGVPSIDIVQLADCNLDFVSIDVEGLSYPIFRRLFESLYAHKRNPPRAIIVEHDGHNVEAADLLVQHGYTIAAVNPENVVALKD